MIPFNIPTLTGEEASYVQEVLKQQDLGGGQKYSQLCEKWIESNFKIRRAMLMPSGTHALEMAAQLIGLEKGDEVVMPSFTFSSTANAFILKGATVVFVDIDPKTMNMDPNKVAEAVTPKTRAIVPVHYGGVACDMDSILKIAKEKQLIVIEDAAQGVQACHGNSYLGSLGHFGCFSFHESKTYQCGEGGALLINEEKWIEDAEIFREKGTNRTRFLRGEVDKYTWCNLGSSMLVSELQAGYLYPQLLHSREITRARLSQWQQYRTELADIEAIELPAPPQYAGHNAHIFQIKTRDENDRQSLIGFLKKLGISAVFHYLPLHSTPPGRRYGRFHGEDIHTTRESKRLLRLPLHYRLTTQEISSVTRAIREYYHGS